MSSLSEQDVLVRSQETPNPYAVKFVVNASLKTQGKATFTAPQDCADLPLFISLLQIPGVRQVYVFENTLTITHDGTLFNEELIPNVESVVKTRLPVHDPDFVFAEEESRQPKEKKDYSDLAEDRRQVEEILDRTIRPGLQADGGDVEVISFENDELRILYQGACGGCPSAMTGTLDAIQGILRNELDNPEILVIPI